MAPRRRPACTIGGAPPTEAVSVLSCIDLKHTAHLARAIKALGYHYSYLDVTAAGASFPLYYPQLQREQSCSCLAQCAAVLQSIAGGVIANLIVTP